MIRLYRAVGTTALCTGLAIFGAASMLAGYAVLAAPDTKFNSDRSLPRGWYKRSDEAVKVGTIVWFRLPKVMQPYWLATSPERAAWFAAAKNGVLKPVAAVAGDTICRRKLAFSINGDWKGDALPQLHGAWLPTWKGCRQLAEGEIATFNGSIPDSLDSRYYGAVPLAEVTAYQPWIVETSPAK